MRNVVILMTCPASQGAGFAVDAFSAQAIKTTTIQG
jgi:hypothetical protein